LPQNRFFGNKDFRYWHRQWRYRSCCSLGNCGAKVVATDISEAALNLAQKNANTWGLKDKIDFRLGNLFEPVDGYF